MLCDSTSPLLKNVSTNMPESLQRLISRMHSVKKRRILAPNSLPVRRQNAEENKMTAKKLSKLFVEPNGRGPLKPKRSRIGLRNVAGSKKSENRTTPRVHINSALLENSPKVGQRKMDSGKSSVDSTQNNTGIPFEPLIESTNTSKIPLDRNHQGSFTTLRTNLFKYPSELTTDSGIESRNVTVKFNPSDTVDQNSNLLAEVKINNAKPEDSENINPNRPNGNGGTDSTFIKNETTPITQNALSYGSKSVTSDSQQSSSRTDLPKIPVINPPLDAAVIKSSLKTKSNGPKKWVTFNDIVQAESQTHFINDFDVDRLKNNNLKSETMRMDIQPIFVDDFYSGCAKADNPKSDFTQITSETNFVDDLYGDSPKTNDTNTANEDLNLAAGNKVQNMINTLRRIK